MATLAGALGYRKKTAREIRTGRSPGPSRNRQTGRAGKKQYTDARKARKTRASQNKQDRLVREIQGANSPIQNSVTDGTNNPHRNPDGSFHGRALPGGGMADWMHGSNPNYGQIDPRRGGDGMVYPGGPGSNYGPGGHGGMHKLPVDPPWQPPDNRIGPPPTYPPYKRPYPPGEGGGVGPIGPPPTTAPSPVVAGTPKVKGATQPPSPGSSAGFSGGGGGTQAFRPPSGAGGSTTMGSGGGSSGRTNWTYGLRT